MRREAGYAEARGDRLLDAGHRGLCDQGADLLGDRGGVFGAGVGQQHEELLAAVASGEVALAHAGDECGSDGGEHVVAGAVTVGVVDLLEVIEVEQDRRERAAAARRLGDHALEGVARRPAVGHAGERVGRSALLGDRDRPEVGDDRRGLGHALSDRALFVDVERLGMVDEQ